MAGLTGVQRAVIAECVRIRTTYEIPQAQVGEMAHKRRDTVNKFEKGTWGADVDALIAVYAGIEGVSSHVIWERAWRQAFRADLAAEERKLRRSRKRR